MQEIKLIVTDLDGTFLTHASESAIEENRRVMRQVQRMGIPVFPCTGRSWVQSVEQVSKYGFDNLCVVNNGASLVEIGSGALRYRNRIAPELVAPLLQLGKKYAGCEILTQVSCHSFIGFLEPEEAMTRERLIGRYGPQLNSENKLVMFRTVEEMIEGTRDAAELIRYIAEPDRVPKQMLDELHAMQRVEVAWSYRLHLDVMAKGANKGSLLPLLADMCGAKVENVMALGDQDNDAPMLAMAGFGVAMGGASPKAKEAADFVSDTAEHSGFAKALKEFVLDR